MVAEPHSYMEQTVAGMFGITTDDLYRRTRLRRIVDARYMLWYFLHHRHGYGWSRISNIYGYNHATVIHGVSLMNYLINQDRKMKTIYEQLTLIDKL